jgi:hypothetical protein
MYVCMYVCLCGNRQERIPCWLCMYVCIYVCIRMRIWIHSFIYMHKCIIILLRDITWPSNESWYIHICIHAHINTYVFTHPYVCAYMSMNIFNSSPHNIVSIWRELPYTHTHTHTRIHTHTHTHTSVTIIPHQCRVNGLI